MSGRTVPLTIKVVLPERFSAAPPVTLSEYTDELTVTVVNRKVDPEYTLHAKFQFSDNGVLVVQFEEVFEE